MKKVNKYVLIFLFFIIIELCCTLCHFENNHSGHKLLKISNEESLKNENITIDCLKKEFDEIVKKTIELINIYSQHIIHDENIQKIFNLNDNIILTGIFNEIIKDLNSSSIELDLFDYYLIILGNLFIFSKNIYENKNKECINLFLNILNKNINLENYAEANFNIINNTLWLIHLYIYFNKSDYVTHYAYILKNIESFFSEKFLGVMGTAQVQSKNNKLFFSIIKEILYSLLNIYSIIFEDILRFSEYPKLLSRLLLDISFFSLLFSLDSSFIFFLFVLFSNNFFSLCFCFLIFILSFKGIF